MLALLFILVMIGLGIWVGLQVSSEVTWLTYYIGGLAGLFVSAMIIEVLNKWKKKKQSDS